MKDIGSAYDATRGYGWVRQDSLSTTTHTPLDLTRNTRDRARAGIDPTLNTIIHMQYGDSPPPMSKGTVTPGAWEYAVPAGTYQVTASVGDQAPYDSVNLLRVEGTTAIPAFRSTTAKEFVSATVTVVVNDGRLTLDAIGGTNTKLNYVQIAKVAGDTTPPPAPTALTATPGDSTVSLGWTASAATDVAGYRLYRGASLVSGASLVTGLSFIDTGAVNGTAVTYTVVAVDTSGNASPASAPATATPAAFSAKVNFSDQATTPPTGYLADYGQSYAAHSGGPSYGWVTPATSTPVSLVGNGRNRNPAAADPDPRLATFVYMQIAKGTPGSWELAVPNGSYTVTAAVGDSGTAVDSSHWLNFEDQNAVAAFVPTATTKHATATRTVTVTDGKLTVSATGGTNTKLDYVDVDSVPGAPAPSIRASTPANLATGVDPRSTSVVEDLRLPAGGVDPSTLTSSTVKLTTVADGTAVAANVITSGGGDVINLSPTKPLADQTLYRFSVTGGVKDVTGHAFAPYSIVFTTGTATVPTGPAAFDKSLASSTSAPFTTLIKGPDGRLYAGTLDGRIFRFPITSDGTLGTPTEIDTVRTHATAAGLAGAPARTVIGMAFDPASTATAPILWISDDYEFVGAYDVPDFSSHIAKLTGPDLGTYTDVITNLPRSVKDHETNSIAFGPDGALYFTQGANNAMGDADATWGNRPEHLLNAAVLRLDTTKLPSTLPLNVQTSDGGTYDPYAAGAPLTLYATGIRNAFDLVWHSNGHLYTPTNGSAAGGNVPATPATLPAACATRQDGAWTGPATPAITNNAQAETDYVFDVHKGKYYGHPNPTRCEWVLAGGNPTAATDPFQVNAYPVGTLPDRNYDLADTYDAGLHASADGAVEYKGNAFGGALNGKLLVVRYSDGQDIETFDVAASGALGNRSSGIPGLSGFNQPLDVTEDNATGNLYVSELGAGRISLLKPQTSTAPAALTAPSRLVFSTVNGTTSATQQVTLTNTGAKPLVIGASGITLSSGAPFVLAGLPTLPYTLNGGASVSFTAAFKPTAAGPVGGTIAITSDGPSGTVVLRGLGTAGVGGTSEPSLQWVFDTYQIPNDVGDPDPTTPGLPTTNPLGGEIPAQTLIKAQDDEPVTITPIAAYGRQTPVPPIKFGWYPPATPAGKTQLGTVDGPGAQSLSPAAPVTFDPGATAFGLYTEWPPFANRDVYTEDALNTFDTGVPHHVRVYPMRNPDGSVVANTLVVATEETTTGQDYQDFVAIVSNVKSTTTGTGTGAAGKGVATVSNLDGFPAPNRLVFSKILALADTAQLTHDTSTLRVTNTGTGDLKITGLPITGKFALVTAPTLPVTVAVGGHLDFPVKFTATSTPRANAGTLTVQSDSTSTPSVPVTLAGFWQSRSEGGQEPTAADLAALFGWSTNIPADLDKNGAVVAQGDEVLSPYWNRADTTKPVTVKQLQAYHTYPNGATVKWFPQGGSAVSLYNINGHYAQSILPLNSANQVATADFTPTTSTFGFAVDGEYSDNTKNKSGPDVTNGCVAPCGHHVLFFPVKDGAGAVVPNTYYLTMDYSSINYDYQDNGYLLTNIKPAA